MAKKRRWRSVLRLLLRKQKDPESMARGVGVGVFVAFLPSVGFQMVLALLLAGLIGGNRIAAAAGTFITNPLTALPVSVASVWVGDLLLSGGSLLTKGLDRFSLTDLWNSPGEFVAPFLVGCAFLSVVGGLLSYLLVRLYHVKVMTPARR